MAQFQTDSAEQTIELGRTMAQLLERNDVIYLDGDLGAGKTQFSKGVAEGLGIGEEVTSPTFPLMVEYRDGRLPLFHFDLYRLEDEGQLDDIDFFGALEAEGVSLVEWGGKFPDALPDDYLEIDIKVLEDERRILTVCGQGERGIDLECAFSIAARPFAVS